MYNGRKIILQQNDNILDKLFKLINIAGTAILMNMLFLICCLPIVTIGQAWCGLLSAIRYNIRGESWFTGFRVGFKTRWVRGILAWIVVGAVSIFMIDNCVGVVLASIKQWNNAQIVAIAINVLFTLMPMMLGTSLIFLNVYIATKPGRWLQNGVTLTFTAPLQMAACALILWAPFVLVLVDPGLFYLALLVLIAVYYLLAALGMTMLVKNSLIRILLQEREAGTLTEDRLDELEEELEDLDGELE